LPETSDRRRAKNPRCGEELSLFSGVFIDCGPVT
jgi:hypothetical protein